MMNGKEVGQVIQAFSGLCTELLEDYVVTRQEMKLKEKEAEVQKEIAEIRQQSTPGRGEGYSTNRPPDPRVSGRGAERSSDPSGAADSISIDPLRRDEDCEMCLQMLNEIDSMEGERKALALSEYGRMKEKVRSGSDADELSSFIADTEVLSEVVEGLA